MLDEITHEPRDEVVLEGISDAKDAAGLLDTEDHGGDTEVGHHDTAPLLLGEEDRVRVEVVGPGGVVLLAGDVEEQESREREELLAEEPRIGKPMSIIVRRDE